MRNKLIILFALLVMFSCNKAPLDDDVIVGEWMYQYTEIRAFYNTIENDTVYNENDLLIEFRKRGVIKYSINGCLENKLGITEFQEVEMALPFNSPDKSYEIEVDDVNKSKLTFGYIEEFGNEYLHFYDQFPYSSPDEEHFVTNVYIKK